MFCDLPRDLQEKIYNGLDVFDRTSLNIALPKTSQFSHKNKHLEKKLGVLVTAVKKGHVKKLSLNVKNFLSSLCAQDSTIDIINEHIPNANLVRSKTDYSKIELEEFCALARGITAEHYEAALSNPIFCNPSFCKKAVEHTLLVNPGLFDYIVTKKPNLLHEDSKRHVRFFSTIPGSLAMMLKHFVYSREEIIDMYAYCIDNMSTDCAEILYKLIN